MDKPLPVYIANKPTWLQVYLFVGMVLFVHEKLIVTSSTGIAWL